MCKCERLRPIWGFYENVGFYQIGEECDMGRDMISVYCHGSHLYCPYLDGDDRYRRKDALTEDVSAQIISGFREILESGRQRLYGLLADVSQTVAKTNYERLYDNYYSAGGRRISLSVSGRFRSVVRSGMEKRQAKKLEAAIEKELDAFEPADMLPCISPESDRLRVSDRDFVMLDLLVSQAAPGITGELDGEDVCSVPEYNEVTRKICRELSNQVYFYLRDLQEGFFEVQRRLQREIGYAALASETGVHGYAGESPRWRGVF